MERRDFIKFCAASAAALVRALLLVSAT